MAKQRNDRPDVVIVGAGVVGLSTALMAQHRGFRALLLDRKGPAAEASRGNAGAFAFSEIIPLATPGVIRKAPRWLFDPLGPLSIPPIYALRLAPWMFRFWRAAKPNRVENGIRAQASLMDHCRKVLPRFLEASATDSLLRQNGNLEVYESRAEFSAARPYWEARMPFDIPFEPVHGVTALADIQPGLDKRFVSGVFTPHYSSIADPLNYCLAIAAALRDRGGTIETADVRMLSPGPSGATVHCADGRTVSARHVVVCAGAWSHRLAATIGDRIPLETERGYNTTLPAANFDLRTQITFAGHGFVVSRIGAGVRVGGAVELGGLERAPNFKRADAMLAKAKTFLPDLDTRNGTQWMGFRPSLPDSLPVIGRAGASRNILYAFGHGHLGLTQSAGTADLICHLLADSASPIDLGPFRADRFQL